ncbi:MAG TPA: hypothetical protein VGG46_06575 [Terriglobales bacterium]|jgi:hypothetical protein
MMKAGLVAGILALCCGLACTSHSPEAANAQQESSSPRPDANVNRTASPTPEVKLAPSTNGETTKYRSGAAQPVAFTVTNLDESKGVTASSGNGCTLQGSPQKTGAGAYTVTLNIPSMAEDGSCYIGMASNAKGTYSALDVPYTADPDYWQKSAPDMYAFVHSKAWTFKTSTGKSQTQPVSHVESTGSRLSAMTTDADGAISAFGLTPPEEVAGTFEQCVLHGTFHKDTITLTPIMQTDDCKKIGTLTVKASN